MRSYREICKEMNKKLKPLKKEVLSGGDLITCAYTMELTTEELENFLNKTKYKESFGWYIEQGDLIGYLGVKNPSYE